MTVHHRLAYYGVSPGSSAGAATMAIESVAPILLAVAPGAQLLTLNR